MINCFQMHENISNSIKCISKPVNTNYRPIARGFWEPPPPKKKKRISPQVCNRLLHGKSSSCGGHPPPTHPRSGALRPQVWTSEIGETPPPPPPVKSWLRTYKQDFSAVWKWKPSQSLTKHTKPKTSVWSTLDKNALNVCLIITFVSVMHYAQ